MRFAVGILLLLSLSGCGSSAATERASGGAGTSGSANAGGSTNAGGGVGNGAANGAGGAAGEPSGGGAFGVGGAGAAYPAGPYGNQLGDVLPNIELEGYLSTETTGLAYQAPFQSLTFADVRQNTDKTHALIHVSGFT